MGILKKLFSLGKKTEGLYIDEGLALVGRLATTLSLPDWKGSSPIYYTDEEIKAINRNISKSQQQLDETGGAGKTFVVRSDLVPTIQGIWAAQALTTLANDSWKFSRDLPANWKQCVSTYLKAWVLEHDPTCLLELGDLLVGAGRRTEAKQVFQIVLLVTTYTPITRHWQKEMIDYIIANTNEKLEELL